jgi:hypothetical protein
MTARLSLAYLAPSQNVRKTCDKRLRRRIEPPKDAIGNLRRCEPLNNRYRRLGCKNQLCRQEGALHGPRATRMRPH